MKSHPKPQKFLRKLSSMKSCGFCSSSNHSKYEIFMSKLGRKTFFLAISFQDLWQPTALYSYSPLIHYDDVKLLLNSQDKIVCSTCRLNGFKLNSPSRASFHRPQKQQPATRRQEKKVNIFIQRQVD